MMERKTGRNLGHLNCNAVFDIHLHEAVTELTIREAGIGNKVPRKDSYALQIPVEFSITCL